jgi:hypothetical protein
MDIRSPVDLRKSSPNQEPSPGAVGEAPHLTSGMRPELWWLRHIGRSYMPPVYVPVLYATIYITST